jgi:hypothetical protein
MARGSRPSTWPEARTTWSSIQRAERWLADQGAVVIELDTLAESPESVPFYEAIGYRPRSIIFERRM